MGLTDEVLARSSGDRRWRWYHGVLFFAGVQAASYGLRKVAARAAGGTRPRLTGQVAGDEDDNAYYNGLTRPAFAPPDRLFPPVWALNNALSIWGLLRVLNMPEQTPGRAEFLRLQAGFWACFVCFGPAYFGLRSPILGALDTDVAFALTAASEKAAVTRLKDPVVALSQSTTLVWLTLAAAVATTMALWNEDDLFGTGASIAAPPAWVKK